MTLAQRDSLDLVEREQELDRFVAMTFDLAETLAGVPSDEQVRAAAGAFVLALEIDCELHARWEV